MEASFLASWRNAAGHTFGILMILGLLAIFFSSKSNAQTLPFVTPGANTNLIGITPDPDHIPDFGLKQQQEPSCVVRPSNPSYIFCAYNDLRASDLPDVQGDSWMGVSMSADEGKTWFSRLAPGFLGHTDSLGMGFAADPSVVSIPGNSPGLAILNFIAAHRDSDDGILAIQRWVEFAQEDHNFWKPEVGGGRIVADGSEGRFIDKPAFAYIIDPEGQQGTIQQTITVEGGQEVTVTTPTGYLVAAYAVYTGGGGGAKVYVKWSTDNGYTWTGTKISEGQNEVTGVSIAAIGTNYVITYRRKADTNDNDAIVSVHCSLTGNQKCTKPSVVFEMCPFDQWATSNTFRTFSFPWAASDGDRYWVFAADRRFAGDASCTPVPDAPGLYSGKSRIVGMSSGNGRTWVGGDNPDMPFVLAPRPDSDNDGDEDGFQVMPVAFGTKGRIDVAWYETIREEQQGLPPGNNELLINDYSSGGTARVFRKADVWMTRLRASCSGGPSAGCTPAIEEPVRVSQYPFVFTDGTDIGQETKAHLPNLQLYASGTLAFKGDYIALATPPFRRLASGAWIPNNVAKSHLGAEAPGYTDAENIFIAWGDNRDVEADFTAPQLLYSPPDNSGIIVQRIDDQPGDDSGYERPGTLLAEDEPDNSSDPTVNPDLVMCIPGAATDFSKSRNSNVYGVLVRDQPSLVAPTPTKPLGTIQRMFPLELTNTDMDSPADFCLVIQSQPEDYDDGTGLASFYQLPAIAPFSAGDEIAQLTTTAPAGSSVSRAVFVTTTRGDSVITVNAYENACPDPDAMPPESLGNLVNSVQLSDGNLFDPLYCQTNACDPVGDVANANETHDLTLVSPGLQAPVLQAPSFQAPGFQAPVLQAPVLQAPGFQAPGFQAPGLQAPVLQAPSFQAPGFQAPVLQAPVLQAPSLQAPSLQAAQLEDIVVQDTTYVLSADGNVTTTYSTDIAIAGLDPDQIEVQLIAWTPNVYATSVDCLAQPQADHQIISAKQLDAPSLQAVSLPNTFTAADQDPYKGELSFTGTPGKDIAITVRIWATGTAKTTLEGIADSFDPVYAAQCDADPDCDSSQLGTRQLIAFGASAQGCATNDAENNTQIPGLPDCLNDGNEKIFQDKFPPVLTLPGDITLEATSSTGAVANFVVTAADDIDSDPDIDCIPASGSDFPLGLNTVSCSAMDASGNMDNASFSITVVDTTAPDITIPADITVEATAFDTPAGDVTLGTATATDLVGVASITNDAPATFPFGQTWVIWSATDTQGNVANGTQNVTIEDTTPPSITAPADVTVEATAPNTPAADVSLGTAIATDLGVAVPVTNNAPGTYPVGQTIVTWVATDLHGTEAMATQVVTIVDTTPPSITAPAAVTVEATAELTPSTDVALGSPTTSDAVGVITTINDAPANFPLGDTTVTWTATDAEGNSAQATQLVTIVDTTAPSIENPADVTVEATGPLTAVVLNTPETSDAAGGTSIINDAPTDGYPVGATTVTWTATDDNGNSTIAEQVVTIVDTTIPTITAPAAVTVEATALNTPSSNVVLGSPVTSDLVGVTSTSSNAPASYPVGVTMVTWTATDAQGNSASAEQLVTITDTTPPSVVAPADVTVEATAVNTPASDVPLGTATAIDIVGLAAPVSSNAPATYAVGQTVVTWSATDLHGNAAVAMQVVTITDTTAPVINVNNGDVFDFEATSPAGAYVDLSNVVIATDKGVEIPVTCTTSTGIVLPAWLAADIYSVTCSTTDGDSSITVNVVINVEVEDLVAPELDIPAETLTVGMDLSTGTAIVDFLAPGAFDGESITVSDNVDTDVAITCEPANGTVFQEGTTQVTCTASDDGPNASGGVNSVQESFEVIVIFPYDIELIVPNGRKKAGSTIPIDFRYLLNNQVVDSSAIGPSIEWAGGLGPNCSGTATYMGNDSGISGFRYSASNKTWQYSWQTPGGVGGTYVVITITPPGTPYPSPASACVNLK